MYSSRKPPDCEDDNLDHVCGVETSVAFTELFFSANLDKSTSELGFSDKTQSLDLISNGKNEKQ